jgi:UDP-N-acetylmuramoylalanine--D-glutamate ligase
MKNKSIIILGAGESGTGAAVLAKRLGMHVFVSDNGTIEKKYRERLLQESIAFEEEGHTIEKIIPADLIIKSPGIPDSIAVIKKLTQARTPVIDETEFASWFTDASLIAVTGSNGKTTTASLVAHILQKSGKKAVLAGNMGYSFAMAVASENADIFVLELSSFQLDRAFSLKPDIAILTNIIPDHLDRYNNDFQKYVHSKFRIIQNMTANDHLIYNADDPEITKELNRCSPDIQLHPYSLKKPVQRGAYANDHEIVFTGKNQFIMTLEELALQGRHNVYNSMAAGVASRLVDIRKESIKNCLSDFQNIEHRLEHVATIHGIDFINDSKATNVNSTWYALESMTRPVIWIAGGLDKGNDYSKLKAIVAEKVKAIICLGKDNSPLIEAFGGIIEELYETQSIRDAVQWSYRIGNDGEAVLLSPACASFDLFKNFEDRGNQFKLAVKLL